MRRTIGILLDDSVFRKVPKKRTGHENLHLYHRAARPDKLAILFTSLENINFRKKTATGWFKRGGRYRLVERSIPAVIHNRAMPSSIRLQAKLRKLQQTSTVFNRKTRYGKLTIYRLLHQYKQLRGFLPETKSFSSKHLKIMRSRYSSLFLKPQSSSLGKGIIKAVKSKSGKWKLTRHRTKKMVSEKSLYAELRKWIGNRSYLIQKTIPLAVYRGKPYDIRISVQKGDGGKWQVTGMVGKVAQKGKFVTNVAQGGRVKTCKTLFHHSGLPYLETREALSKFALQTARHLESKLSGLADLGLDVGLESDGAIRLIEVNGRDQRYSFKEAGMVNTWYHTYRNPIRYARYLLTKGRGSEQ